MSSSHKSFESSLIRYQHIPNLLQQHSQGAQNSLEIGCGGARYTSYVSGHYTGVDLPKVRYEGPGPNIFADGQWLPFKDGSFDFIFMIAVLHIIPDVHKVLQGIERVLKPGGSVLVLDYNLPATRRLASLNQAEPGRTSHVWSSWKLAKKLQDSGIVSKIEWDFVRGSSKPLVFLQRFKLIRFLRFWFWQFMNDWSIVSGYKPASTRPFQ